MEQGPFPRITIQFCTQCKWMLRAAYFAQELLSTFSTSLGEVALQPSTGGTFVVQLYNAVREGEGVDGKVMVQQHLLWDRKVDGGFPETKELKRRVRDIIDPSRDLGHVDGKKSTPSHPQPPSSTTNTTSSTPDPTSSSAFTPIPKAINRLQALPLAAERKFTPMDVDVSSRPGSSKGDAVDGGNGGDGLEKEVLNSRGKIVIGGADGDGESYGFCRPGEDCEDCG
ncbi:hypothetical protein BDZ45DRAFT_712112 [Acephala macrosclerotiorum]|nr:hypothetical protein BDZ45DRAFT_712112 [Acephala macrosclerotiorum]